MISFDSFLESFRESLVVFGKRKGRGSGQVPDPPSLLLPTNLISDLSNFGLLSVLSDISSILANDGYSRFQAIPQVGDLITVALFRSIF